MAGVNDPCNGGVALFLLKNERSDTAKKELLQDLISKCADKKIKESNKGNKSKSNKPKRKLSWYNCCIRKESIGKEKGYAMNSGVCGKEKITDAQKKEYQAMVDENGCEV